MAFVVFRVQLFHEKISSSSFYSSKLSHASFLYLLNLTFRFRARVFFLLLVFKKKASRMEFEGCRLKGVRDRWLKFGVKRKRSTYVFRIWLKHLILNLNKVIIYLNKTFIKYACFLKFKPVNLDPYEKKK